VLNRSRRVASSLNTEAESSEKTSIEELLARLLAFKTRDGELLQSKQSIRSALTEIDKSELKSTEEVLYFADKSEVNVLQNQLFDALYAAKQADPEWQLDNKYKEVLTQEQIKRLSTKNMVIENTKQQ
jgi:microcystin degradation protein MlrC